MSRAFLSTCCLTFCLLLALPLSGQRGRKSDMVAPTASADRLNVAATHASLASASWTSGLDLRSVGPTVMSGRVVDLAVNPDNPAEFVVAYATGGIWHTTDQGTSFQPLFDHDLMMFVGALAVDWQNRHIWVGTGEVNCFPLELCGNWRLPQRRLGRLMATSRPLGKPPHWPDCAR